RQPTRDGALQEESDHLSVGGRYLLAQDDREPVVDAELHRAVAHRDRPFDVVVVRHRDMGQATVHRDADELVLRQDRVPAEAGMDVEVGESERAGAGSHLRDGFDIGSGSHGDRQRHRHEPRTRLLRNWSKCSRARPVPTATELRALSATWHGMPVNWVRSAAMLRSSEPPPVITIPLSMMSLESSGGVCSSTLRTAVMIWESGASIASVTSPEVIGMVRGRPAIMSRPWTSICIGSGRASAEPMPILTSSAVRSPTMRLYLRRM